jgi:acyl dehydratase
MFKVDTKEPPDRFFEDFSEGLEMPAVTKGPMQAGHQVRWAGACDNYASEFHHDEAIAKAQGLPGLLLSGPFMASYMLTEVTHWLGRRARVRSFWDRNTAPTRPRDLAHIHAKVKAVRIEDGKGLVEVECRIVNQDGTVTTPGGLVAELPLRDAARPTRT